MAAATERGIPLSAVSPRYLHTNSTSHTGPFSAIAELIDNAYDPDVSAKQLWIDKTLIKSKDCLIFMDNGNGIDYDKMHKMLSLGFSDKPSKRGHPAVGLYGNGFKSGSMRLGKDVIVFSKKADTMCVGLLSQTYLEKIEAHNVIVPIVMFKKNGQNSNVAPEYEECLHDILAYSLFNTREELLSEFSAIDGPYDTSATGTRIIIWNLRKTSSGLLEFDFTKDRYDIQLPVDVNESTTGPNEPESGISAPDSEYSLQAYSSILYLKPRMQIIIRGKKVKTQLVSKSLAHTFLDTYKPTFLKKGIKITFGYNTKSKDHYGLMLYHKNRLIKAYEHAACQRKANKTGVGVVGVLECNHLTPMHNKQDFERTDEYRKTIQNVSSKLEEYWKELRYRRQKIQNCSLPVEDDVKKPDQNWVQCDTCGQWRKLPDGIDTELLPEKWFCYMNPDPQFRSCAVEEEPEDSDDEQPRYQKTYKQDEKNQKLQKEKDRQQSPALEIPDTPHNSYSHRNAGSRFAFIPTAFPMSARQKRALNLNQENKGIKRAKLIRFLDSNTPGNPSTSIAPPKFCSSSNIIHPDRDQASSNYNETLAKVINDDGDDNDYDNILIIESISSASTKSTTGTFNNTKVKLECMLSEEELGRQMNHRETDTVVAMDLPPVSYRDACIGTKTEQSLAVKQEEDSEARKQGKDGESNHFESEKDFSLVKMNSSTELKSVNEERISQQNSVTSTEKENQESINSKGELIHREISNEISGQTSAKLETQQQQDDLLQCLEVVTKERDKSQAQLRLLSLEVGGLRSQLLELTQSMLKKENNDQNRQTSPEEAPGPEDYKVLYLQGKEAIKQLQEELRQLKIEKEERERKGQQALLEYDEDIACQIDFLLRQNDQANKEQEELMNKVDSLENEKSALLTSCESLRKELEKTKREGEKLKLRAEDREVQTDLPICLHEQSAASPAVASTPGGGTDFGTQQHETHQILRDLRQKVARLLVTFVPALDLQQVNYECSVIDEILTQVVNELSPAENAST